MPDAFVLTTGDDPDLMALYSPATPGYWERTDPVIYERYVRPKYSFGPGLDTASLDRQNIGYVILESPAHKADADRNPHLARIGDFGRWTLYGRAP